MCRRGCHGRGAPVEALDGVRDVRRRHAEHPDRIRASIRNVLTDEKLSEFFKEHLLNPTLLDYAEHVMGCLLYTSPSPRDS